MPPVLILPPRKGCQMRRPLFTTSTIAVFFLAAGSTTPRLAWAALDFGGCPAGSPIVVTTTADEWDLVPNSDCSLREAITAANLDAGGDAIELVAGATYTLDLTGGIIDMASDDLDVVTPIAVNGNGATITRSSLTPFRIFEVGALGVATGNLALNDVTITNGDAGAENGGGVLVNQTSILNVNTTSISGVSIAGNRAANGGGVYVDQGGTLDVAVLSTQGTSVDASLLAGNVATGSGGGLYVSQTGSAVIGNAQFLTVMNRSPLVDNSAGASGGAVYVAQGGLLNAQNLAIAGSWIAGNDAGGDGGGIFVDQNGTVDVQDTVISGSLVQGNDAGANGGGIAIA